jgi:hypothetical protein
MEPAPMKPCPRGRVASYFASCEARSLAHLGPAPVLLLFFVNSSNRLGRARILTDPKSSMAHTKITTCDSSAGREVNSEA